MRELSKAAQIGRRGELLAELFLQELGATFVARQTFDLGFDFFVGFENSKGGINTIAVEVKATDRKVPNPFVIREKNYEKLSNSNIPVLLLVVDAQSNSFYFSWIKDDEQILGRLKSDVRIRLTQVNEETKSLLVAKMRS